MKSPGKRPRADVLLSRRGAERASRHTSGQPQFGQAYQQPQGQPGYPVAPYQQPYPQGYPAAGSQVVPKNPGIALLISFFLPGVGSLYAGKVTTGVIIIACYIVSWILTIVIIGFVGVFGFWVWGMIDAYQAAQTWNRQHGLVSQPPAIRFRRPKPNGWDFPRQQWRAADRTRCQSVSAV
jgi:TM2 domain-containing membrane protein YozV